MSNLQPNPIHNQTADTTNEDIISVLDYVLLGLLVFMTINLAFIAVALLLMGIAYAYVTKFREFLDWYYVIINRAEPRVHRHNNQRVYIRRNWDTLTNRECTICLERLVRGALDNDDDDNDNDNDNVVVLGACQHVFHLSCIIKWVARNKSCPVCRKVVDRLVLRVHGAGGEANSTNFSGNRGISLALEVV